MNQAVEITCLYQVQEKSGFPPDTLIYDSHGMDILRIGVEDGLICDGDPSILTGLAKLSSHSGGHSDLSPDMRLAVAISSANGQSMREVAKMYGLHHSQVARAVRDTVAVYLSGTNVADFPEVPDEVGKRILLLENVEETLERASTVREHPAMEACLRKVPHVCDLIDSYLAVGTAKYILEAVGVRPVSTYQLRTVGRYLNADGEDALDGLSNLAMRYAIGRWLSEWKFYGSGAGDRAVSRGAVFLLENDYSHLPGRLPDRMRTMRLFLTEMMLQEFDIVIGKSADINDVVGRFFPGSGGAVARKREELDVLGAYKEFAKEGYCPSTIRLFGERVLSEAPKSERIKTIRPGEVYSEEWLNTLDWAGMKFLENLLCWPSPERRMNWSIFSQNTNALLKAAKLRIEREKCLTSLGVDS